MIIEDWNLPHPLLNKMQSQTLCTISEASTPSTQLRLARLFKPKQIFPESNGSYNFKANTKHRYGTINTAPTMNDHNEINSNKKEPGRQMCIVETASADSGNTPEIRDYPTMRNREQRKAYRRMLAEVEENVRKQITEDDLHKIFSAPMEKRHSRTSTVNSPDIVWSYIPREHDGMTIDLFTASTILRGVSDSVLRQKLRKIPGLVLSTSYFILVPTSKAKNSV